MKKFIMIIIAVFAMTMVSCHKTVTVSETTEVDSVEVVTDSVASDSLVVEF